MEKQTYLVDLPNPLSQRLKLPIALVSVPSVSSAVNPFSLRRLCVVLRVSASLRSYPSSWRFIRSLSRVDAPPPGL